MSGAAGPKPAGVTLRLDGISKSFGSTRVLEPLDLDIADGEMLALLGPSGCGKTTTLRIIAGFEVPDTGGIVIGGRDVTALPPNKRSLGMVFQNYSLFPHMTVGENVAFGLKMRGMNGADRTRQARSMLEMVRLAQYEGHAVHQLSGGQQQRVALARALATAPAILLLDEPLGALDKNLRERMQFELREIQRKLNITSILVTHDQEEALTMSDRIAVMMQGTVVQVGHPTDVYNRPRTRFVAEFLGTANIFAGMVADACDNEVWSVALDVQPGACGRTRAPLVGGQRVVLAVRPERVGLATLAEGVLRASVRDVVFRGSHFAYELSLVGQDAPVFLTSQTPLTIPEDGLVGLTWAAEDAVVLRDDA